jgi:uncharacterized repeat protein (TIGR01451 family)
MKNLLKATLAIFAFGLLASSAASAAVSLSFTEADHVEPTTNRGDEVITYSVRVKNTGTTPTTAPVNVSVSLPDGAQLGAGGESGVDGKVNSNGAWTCRLAAELCTTSGVVAPGAELPPLSLNVWLFPQAPETFTASFLAFGGGAGADASAFDSFTFGPALPFDILDFTARAEDEAGLDFTRAGGHPPAATSSLRIPSRRTPQKGSLEIAPVEELRDLYFELPAGFVGNPESVPHTCKVSEVRSNLCPEAAVAGGISLDIGEFKDQNRPIFRVIPEQGYPAAFAFRPVGDSPITVVLRASLRANGDYGVTAVSPLPPQQPAVQRIKYATLCSYGGKMENGGLIGLLFISCKEAGEPGANPVPFLTMPTRCVGADVTRAYADSHQHPATRNEEGFPVLSDPNWKSAEATAPLNEDCQDLTEAWTGSSEPSFTFRPDSTRAAAPAGYSAHLHIPQGGLQEASGLATAHLKDTTVTLPEDVVLNPSAADGLGACSLERVGYLGNGFGSPNPVRFSTVSDGCPLNSKVGIAEVSTPILGETLDGDVYLAAQDKNPFGSKFAVYLVIDDEKTGIRATLPGKVAPDSSTGQITASFANNPQAPVEDVRIDFFEGPRASLTNPSVCASYTTATQLTPWSAANPEAPLPSEIADPSDTIGIDTPPAGSSSCSSSKSERPFAPSFTAGSTNPTAGAHSQFTLRLTREDGQQEFSGVKVTTPPGFAATLKGVAICSDGALSAAASKTGKEELANPSCPGSSQVGTTTIGAGSGPSPFYLKTGKVYLSGPYKGAPLSFTFVVPAVAGPFDLGVQVVRTALQIDPKTAQVTAVSDPIPQILEGVPLQVRDIRVDLDRSNFTLNPTSCAVMSVSGLLTGSNGGQATPTSRFQVGGCENLGFKPKLKLQLHGNTKRASYQRLEASLTARPGDANIARASVALPHSAFLAQEHIRTVCTRVQFAADSCPKGSVYGTAEATSPLLDGKLSGPVYLRSSDNPLPDLVVALKGPDAQPIEVELAGRTDSVNGGIRNTFDIVPDAPVSSFKLKMFGGKKSLIVNSTDLCKGKPQKATVKFDAQNGKNRNFRTVVGNDCGKKKGKKSRKGEGKKAARQHRAETRQVAADLLPRIF